MAGRLSAFRNEQGFEMTILRCCLFSLMIIFAGMVPVLAQESGGASTAQEQAPSTDVEQANQALIKVLNDPKSRAELIDLLKKNAGSGQPAEGDRQVPGSEAVTPVDEASPPLQQENFALRIGEYTRALVDDAGYLLQQAMRSLNGLVLVAGVRYE